MQLSGITNQVRQGGVCIRHGAKVKRCSSEGCRNNAQTGGECKRHGARVNICISEVCISVCSRRWSAPEASGKSLVGRGYCKVGVIREPMPEPLFL